MTNEHISLIELGETIADNKFVLGDRLVEIGISGPTLEGTLSSIAMAQQELGHSRLLYRWVSDLTGVKAEVKDQTGKAFQQNVKIGNWIELIAGLYVTNVAVDLVMRAMIEANNPNVNPPFTKMLKEQQEHLIYSENWCEQLLLDKGSIPRRCREAIDKTAQEAKEWLIKVENDMYLVTENIISKETRLVEQFNATIQEISREAAKQNVG
ncbi:Phenylacetic acid catabolic protein [Fredinandcohnia sp. QZ13]|uniref:Phenylacetic acid catabolic protein n=1 Tax=Fredinandcohnia sp. QZ13 TaxID=3073144 RepID=UPI0028535845|nr:Phenylacetic acid catabolic protein [Fredinandcohnia sp. QZ13]MDR4887660.1 Phenylacetic acid catabolic protein [Fredinandcohnia sp. QZ13]